MHNLWSGGFLSIFSDRKSAFNVEYGVVVPTIDDAMKFSVELWNFKLILLSSLESFNSIPGHTAINALLSYRRPMWSQFITVFDKYRFVHSRAKTLQHCLNWLWLSQPLWICHSSIHTKCWQAFWLHALNVYCKFCDWYLGRLLYGYDKQWKFKNSPALTWS